MARQKLGAFARLRNKRDARLAEKKKAAGEKIAVVAATTAPAKEAAAAIVVAKEAATAAQNKAINAEAAGAKLVSPAKVQSLKHQAEAKVVAVRELEAAETAAAETASSVVASDLGVALNAFDWALILFSAAADELKINRWYAIGGATVLAGLFYLAEKQGWLDFINF